MPVLLYGLEACPLNKAALNSLDFVINRFFYETLQNNNIDIVSKCQKEFEFSLPSALLAHRSQLFLVKYKHCDNDFCKSLLI